MKFNEKRNNNYSPNIEIIFLLNNLNASQKTNSLERKKIKNYFIIVVFILFEILSIIYNLNKINFEKKELKKKL